MTSSRSAFGQFRILKDTLSYSSSGLLAMIVGMVSGLWIAKLLGPTDFGVWNALSLLLFYGAFTDLGVLSTLGRDLPIHQGEGDLEKANAVESTARWVTVIASLGVGAAVVVASYLPPISRQPVLVLQCLRLMAVVLVLQQVYTYHRTILRAQSHFSELSQQQALLSLMTAGATLAGVMLLGLAGRVLGTLLAQTAILVYAVSGAPWRRVPRPRMKAVWLLVRVGVPISASGLIMSLVTTIDRPMVLAYLGQTQLGYFGLAQVPVGLVWLVGGMASQVLQPRIAYRFGESGRNVAAVRSYVLTPPLVLACMLPMIIGPLYLLLPLAITFFLPAFEPAVQTVRIVLIGFFFFSIVGVTDYFLVTTGRLKQLVWFSIGALVLNVLLDYAVLRAGYGINGVAFTGTGVTYFIYSSTVIGYALSHYTRNPSDWLWHFSQLWLPFVYMLALLWLLDLGVSHWLPTSTRSGLVVSAAVKVALYVVGTAPLLLRAGRVMKLELSFASLSRVLSAPMSE